MKCFRTRSAVCGLSALLCASALTMDMSPIRVSTENSPSLALRIANLTYGVAGALSDNPMAFCLIALGAFFFFRRCLYKSSQDGVLDKLLAFLLALFMLLSKGLLAQTQVPASESETLVSYSRTIFVLWSGNTQVAKSAVCLAGFYCLWLAVIHAVKQGLDILALEKPFQFRHPFGAPFCLLTACWLAQALLRYPGVLLWDTAHELGEYYGKYAFDGLNPPVHVLLCGWITQLGLSLGSMSLGLFLLTLLQTFSQALVVAYSLWLFQRWRLPKAALYGTLVLTLLSPIYGSFASTISKDSAYISFFLLFLLQTAFWLLDPEQFWQNPVRNLALWAVSVLLSAWMRKNGLYVVIACTILVIVPFGLMRKRREPWLRRFLPVICVSMAIICAILGESALNNVYGVGGGSRREALSLPFQQTARLLRDLKEEIPQDECDIIDRVLDAGQIGTLYKPNISDPVKATFRESVTWKELGAYFAVWLKQGLRYPLVYLDATANMMHNLFSPLDGSLTLYPRTTSFWLSGTDLALEGKNWPFADSGELCFSLYQLLSHLPVVNLLTNIGFTFDMVLILCCIAIQKRQRVLWGILLPLLVSAGFLFFSPICYTRYALPLLYGLPVAFAACLTLCRKKEASVRSDTIQTNVQPATVLKQ